MAVYQGTDTGKHCVDYRNSRLSLQDLLRLMQLRFKIMDYFLHVLRKPATINDQANKVSTVVRTIVDGGCLQELLQTLWKVLEIEHREKGYSEVRERERKKSR